MAHVTLVPTTGRPPRAAKRISTPSEFLLNVVNDAKALRNKVEEFLGVAQNTFENERPTPRRLARAGDSADREGEALRSTPLDIQQLIVEATRRSEVLMT